MTDVEQILTQYATTQGSCLPTRPATGCRGQRAPATTPVAEAQAGPADQRSSRGPSAQGYPQLGNGLHPWSRRGNVGKVGNQLVDNGEESAPWNQHCPSPTDTVLRFPASGDRPDASTFLW